VQITLGVAGSGKITYVTAWTWANRNYRNHPGDVDWLMREALRRAVDIRDRGSEPLAGRPVMLVDVLNALKDALGFDGDANGAAWLWSDTD
jgi:hypothetical protein